MQNTMPAAQSDSSASRPFVGWLVVGIAGVGLLFVVSVHFPDTIKIPGLFAVGLAAAAGWGLGRWGAVLNIQPTLPVIIAAWSMIAGGEVISTVKTARDTAAYLRKLPKYQESSDDPIIEGLKRALDAEPNEQTDEDRRKRQEVRDAIVSGELKRRELLQHLTFHGFLKDRIPKAWGKWSNPWPGVFWVAEIVLGSSLGAWLTLYTLPSGSQRGPAAAVSGNPETPRIRE
jgi:hypothetical protein